MLILYFLVSVCCVCKAADLLHSDVSDMVAASHNIHDKEIRSGNSQDVVLKTRIVGGKLARIKETGTKTGGWNWTNCGSCGIGLNTRITGGTGASISEFPWMVALRFQDNFICGGSLINRNFVLTAAHCVKIFDPTGLSVAASATFDQDKKGFTSSISRVVIHQNYVGIGNGYDYDVAILKLEKEIPLGKGMAPVCLPTKNMNLSGQIGVVTGWGTYFPENGTAPVGLQKVSLPIVTNKKCQQLNRLKETNITERMICAGFSGEHKGPCRGDSGGPLVWRNNGVFTQVGVASQGSNCSEPDSYGIFTRVTSMMVWIMQHVPNQSC